MIKRVAVFVFLLLSLNARTQSADPVATQGKQIDPSTNDSMLLVKKGSMKWPVDSNCFVIVTTQHLLFNNPVKTLVRKDSCTMQMRCVAGGEVRAAGEIPGKYKFVVVCHGEYLTAYAGFDKLLVNKGDIVKCGQPLGRWINDFDNTDVTFQVWKGAHKENMEEWLAPNQSNPILKDWGIELHKK